MMLKDTPQYKQLMEAMESIRELKIPEHLQQKALEHLLSGSTSIPTPLDSAGKTSDLRQFMAKISQRGAVAEIPALLYWAKTNEGRETANERDIVELYRRAGMRPPKNIRQSMRDLASKKYLRLEVVKGEPGYIRLSRTGEDTVLHELIPSTD